MLYFSTPFYSAVCIEQRGNLRSHTGRTPMEIAAALNYASIIEILRKYCAKE